MKITEALVEDTARLARLEVPAQERAALAAELGRIVDYMDMLAGPDAADARQAGPQPRQGDGLRPDVPRPSVPREALLAAAPAVRDGAVLVPRTVE